MKLALSLPIKHYEDFKPHVDAFVVCERDITPTMTDYLAQLDHPWWLEMFSFSKPTCELVGFLERTKPSLVMLPRAPRQTDGNIPADHVTKLLDRIKHMPPGIKTIIPWDGRKQYSELFYDNCEWLGLPADVPRGFIMDKQDLEAFDYHYIEFCTMDELRRHCPASLNTCAPITAAQRGIDLASRERRPKHLSSWINPFQCILSDKMLDLALKNIKSIREAAGFAG
jgi:hypothetical protein